MVWDRTEIIEIDERGHLSETDVPIGTLTVNEVAIRALDAGAYVTAQDYIPSLIRDTSRPGRTLTGRTAPFWPIYTGLSSNRFAALYDERDKTITIFNDAINVHGENYPQRIEEEQGSLDKFFLFFEPLIEDFILGELLAYVTSYFRTSNTNRD